MPGSLLHVGELRRNRRRIDIPLDDGNSVYIEYRPAALTEGLRLEMQAVLESDDDASNDDGADNWQKMAVITHFLLAVIAEWDVLDKAGRPIPLTAEAFRDALDYEEQLFLFSTITEDSRLGERTGSDSLTPSASTLSPTGKPGKTRRRSRNGSH